jgi:hypothetical protein
VEPVLRRAFEKKRGFPEEDSHYVCWDGAAIIQLPPYCQRCRLIDLDVLSSGRRVSCALFISDVLSCKLDCHIILSSLRLNVYLYNTRYRFLLKEDRHRTNYRMNEPLNKDI